MNTNKAEKTRAQNLSEYLSSLGLIDCCMSDDNRITHKGGNSRLDRIMYRLQGKYKEKTYYTVIGPGMIESVSKFLLNETISNGA